jgi:Fe-Mn family superoxide dismutase
MQVKLPEINLNLSELNPVISELSFQKHLQICKNYVDDFNNQKGDIPFNKAGAHLHRLFFENLREFRVDNKPLGKSAQILELRYGSWDNFLKTYLETVDKLQGSGWVFMNTSGYLNIIPNNRIVDNIGFVIDFWEHSYYPDYGLKRTEYAKDILNLINWSKVNDRMLEQKVKNKNFDL